jgi:hypothetical protein
MAILLPVFDMSVLELRLGTAMRFLMRGSPRFNVHIHEIVANLGDPNVESDIPVDEKHYILGVLKTAIKHRELGMPPVIVAASLAHVQNYARQVELVI